MKYCPECRSSYTDKSLMYCLQDGSVLSEFTDLSSQEKTKILDKESKSELKKELKSQEKRDIKQVDESVEKPDFASTKKIITTLFFLLIGVFLGIGFYYVWQSFDSPKNEPLIVSPQTNNIPNNSMEILRAEADRKPLEVIRRLEETPQKDASDYYILGRAHLANKNYKEAMVAFLEARNHLKDVTDGETKAVLTTDIAQGLVVSQDRTTQAMYEKERKITGNF